MVQGQPTGAASAQGWLAILPAFVLAWPLGGPLEHDFAPRATGFGLAAVLAVPGVVLFVLRRVAPSVRGSLVLGVPLLATAVWLAFGDLTDSFEAVRAAIGWALVLAAFLMGAASDPRALSRGAALVGLAAAVSGFAAPHAGALGNSGATSEVATLGAAAGAMLCLRDRSIWRVVGGAAVLAFLWHAARAPVLAGSISIGVAAILAGFALPGFALPGRALHGRARVASFALAVIALAAVLAPFAPFAIQHERAHAEPTATATSAALVTSPAGGLGVRASIHASSARLLAAHPFAGVGPGQFPAQFPPFRDPAEIERSSHGRLQAAETEVEHAHDDWIQPALELGLVAGLAWFAFLAFVALAAWRALRSGDAHLAALGAGAIALLVHAFARAPITSNAASATLFAAAAGALLVRREAGRPSVARRFAVLAPMIVLVLLAPRAWSFVRHGFALHALVDASDDDPELRERVVEHAASIAPDSVLALSLRARLAEAHDESAERIAAHWANVLDVRPHRVEALVQFATASARAGDLRAAREALANALELDPGNPPALQNLATIELQAGELESGLARLARIPGARAPDVEWLRGLAARLALRGLEAESIAITARAEPERAHLTPDERYALARELRAAGRGELADGWEARAHSGWAEQHATVERWPEAVRSLRQTLRLCLERPDANPVRVRLALAAALQSAGRTDEARAQLAAIDGTASARDLAVLPAWTKKPLEALGVP